MVGSAITRVSVEELSDPSVKPKLSESAIILGDNAHCNSELHDFSVRNDRRFLYWQEWPVNHWYPGGGIGFSFKSPEA